MNRRNSILKAAQNLILREGAGAFTLERLAAEAKISKGGFLYHFASKEELVAALVARTIESFEKDLARFKKKYGAQPGAKTRAFISATCEGGWARKAGLSTPQGFNRFATAMAAFSTFPQLIGPWQKVFARCQADLEADGIDPLLATIILLASDGLWFNAMLGICNFSAPQKKLISEGLKKLTRVPIILNANPSKTRRQKNAK